MAKKIVVVNASPRLNFNTDTLLTNASKGAESKGAIIEKVAYLVLDARKMRTNYVQLVENYKNTFERFIGPTKTLISGNTLQLKDYIKMSKPL